MIKKRVWTRDSAMSWLGAVANGRERHGLKACSALSYLRGIRASEMADAAAIQISKRIKGAMK